jgi:DNA-binding transcriptional ArsR family regulator
VLARARQSAQRIGARHRDVASPANRRNESVPGTWLLRRGYASVRGGGYDRSMAVMPRQDAARRERLVTIFSALSDPTRMEMLEMIVERGELGCAEFDEHFGLSKSTISYHTKLLNAAGLIETRREGRFFFYRAKLAELESEFPGLAAQLTER